MPPWINLNSNFVRGGIARLFPFLPLLGVVHSAAGETDENQPPDTYILAGSDGKLPQGQPDLSKSQADFVLPVSVRSPHCVEASITDFQNLIQKIQADPKAFALGQILPAIVDHGTFEIELSAPLKPGNYPTGIEVKGNTWLRLHLSVKDGRPEGSLRFDPGIIKHDPKAPLPLLGRSDISWLLPSVEIIGINITSDPKTGEVRFLGTAYQYGFEIKDILGSPMDITPDISPLLMGQELSVLKGPLSQIAKDAAGHFEKMTPEELKQMNMVDMAAARFRIRINPQPGQEDLPPIGDVSRIQAHLPEIKISETLSIQDISAGVEIYPNLETKGFRLVIPEARIGLIHHDPGAECGDGKAGASEIHDLRVKNLTLVTGPIDFNDLSKPPPILKGEGRLLLGKVSLSGDDAVLEPLEGDRAVTLEITGDPANPKKISAKVRIPRLAVDQVNSVTLGGELMGGKWVTASLDDLVLGDGEFVVGLTDGEIHYSAHLIPSLAAVSVEQRNPEQHLLIGASINGFRCEKISAQGEINSGIHEGHLTGCQASGKTEIPDVPTLGPVKADLGLDPLDVDAAIHPTGSGTYEVKINTKIEGVKVRASQGTLKMSGNLVGTVQVVNISTDPSKPIFRPVAGSLKAELHQGIVVGVNGLPQALTKITGSGILLPNGRIEIRDDPSGHLTLTGSLPSSLSKLPRQGTHLRPRISVDLSQSVRTFKEIPYYEPTELDEANASLLAHLSQGALGTLTVRGKAAVSGLRSGHPSVTGEASLPLGKRRIELPGGTVELDGGGVEVQGNEQNIDVDIRPPKEVRVHFTQEINGVSYEFDGVLKSNASFHASVGLPEVNVKVDQRREGEGIPLEGNLTVTAREKGKVIGGGEVKISANYQIEATGDKRRTSFSLRLPETGLTGHVTDDIRIGPVRIPKGSEVKIPMTGFAGEVTVDLRTFAADSTWTAGDIGPAKISILGSPLKGLVSDLEGAISVALEGKAGGQQYRLRISPRGEMTLEGVQHKGTLKPYTLSVDARVGKALSVLVGSSSQADGIRANLVLGTDPESGLPRVDKIDLIVDGFSLLSQVDGQTKLPIRLSDLDTRALLERLEVRYDIESGELVVDVDTYDQSPVTPPPKKLEDWLAWKKADWRRYRDQLNDPQYRHLAVLSEANANFPNSPFPRGSGNIYVDLTSKKYRVKLSDFDYNGQRVLVHLGNKIAEDLVLRREYPNPPLPKGYKPRDSMIYNPGQDTLFILDPNDTELMERIQKALGLDDNEARTLFESGRIDLEDLIKVPRIAENFSEEVIRGLVQAFFDGRPHPDFKKNSHRFWLALEDMVSDQRATVGFRKEFWSTKIRTTIPRDFGPEFQAKASSRSDGVNMTVTAYLPYSPGKVFARVTDMARQSYWMPWVDESQEESDGTFSGTVEFDNRNPFLSNPKFRYQVRGRKVDHGPVRTFSYDRVPEAGGGFETYSGRVLVVPHKKGGTFLVLHQAVDFVGRDAEILKGRDEDLSVTADPNRAYFRSENPFWVDVPGFFLPVPTFKGDLPKLNSTIERMVRPNSDPADILRYRLNRAISNLNAILHKGEWIDFRGTKASPTDLSHVPTSVQHASQPKEFMALAEEPGESDSKQIVIQLKVEPSDQKRVVRLLTDGLGIDETKAMEYIRQGKIPIEAIADLPFVKENLERRAFESLAQLFLVSSPNVNEPFLSRGERFLLFLHDFRTRLGRWTTEDGDGKRVLDFRNLTAHGRFHRWSRHNNVKPSDGTDSIAYAVFPKKIKFATLASRLEAPDNFPKYSVDFMEGTNAVECSTPKQGRRCVNMKLDMKVAKPAVYRIEVHAEAPKFGPLGVFPWTYTLRPDIPENEQGFQENEGYWVVIPLKKNQENLVMRVGLLNSYVDGDAGFAKTAMERVAIFLSGLYKGRALGSSEESESFFRFGEAIDTK